MLRKLLILLSSLATPALAAEVDQTVVETTQSVAIELDSCLDHSVKELGMSAKRRQGERRWDIGPQFIHPSIAKVGAVEVVMDKALIRVSVRWPGAPKDAEVQRTIEERVGDMTRKMAQICGVTQAQPTCTVQAPGKPAAPCPPHTT